MSLKPTLETLDGLHEEVAKLYTKKDGKFVLDVEDSGLKSALQKERERAEAAERALKDHEKAKTEAERQAEEAKALAKGDYEKLKANLEAREAALVKENETSKEALKSYLMKAELSQAIAQHKGTPHLLKLVQDQFEAVLDPAGAHKVLVKGDPSKTPAQFIESLKSDASYGAFFEGSGVSGGGAPPAGGKPAGGAKTMPRTQFNSLHPTEQAAFVRGGGRPID